MCYTVLMQTYNYCMNKFSFKKLACGNDPLQIFQNKEFFMTPVHHFPWLLFNDGITIKKNIKAGKELKQAK